jgi:hypothetical protein
MDEKKKIYVVGALFAVVIAVGAFQVVNMTGPDAPPPPAPKKKEDAKNADAKPEIKNPIYAKAYAERDPFEPDAQALNDGTTVEATKPISAPVLSAKHHHLPSLPPIGIDRSGGLPPMQITPDPSVKPAEPRFEYRLSGVVVGQRPAAVFVDPQGGQRLVPLGGSLDGDSKIVGIERGTVTVSVHGKTMKISPGGNGSAN